MKEINKELLKHYKETDKELLKHYKELFTTSCNELQFARLQVEHLYSVLDELLVFVNGLEKDVIENALQKHQLDKLIHAKLLFTNPDKLKK